MFAIPPRIQIDGLSGINDIGLQNPTIAVSAYVVFQSSTNAKYDPYWPHHINGKAKNLHCPYHGYAMREISMNSTSLRI